MNQTILGMQWGDEGKGKVIDLLAHDVDYVVRCQGGANAGHTVVVNGQKTVLHLLPSGALHGSIFCVIGNGVVVDPHALGEELDDLLSKGMDLRPRLLVSDRAHLVLPFHKSLDAAYERAKGKAKVGTTLRGIGPCYGDKIARVGLRCGDLKDWASFTDKLRHAMEAANAQLRALGNPTLPIDETLAEFLPKCKRIEPLVADTFAILHEAAEAGKRMLFEGAQGALLDIDNGSYPFVTSSNTSTGGVMTGCGLSHKYLGRVIGIVKAYSTRVGSGAFPSEIPDDQGGNELRKRGGEFGATTGRPRRCGWLDLVAVKYATRLNGIDSIAVTKLDVLSPEKEIKVCTAYKIDGKLVHSVPARISDAERAEPVYTVLPGWQSNIDGVQKYSALPAAARAYIAFLEKSLGVPVQWIGTGPDREHTIIRDEIAAKA